MELKGHLSLLSILLIGSLTLGTSQLLAQNPFINAFQEQFQSNVTSVHQEKLFIHTDRVAYITGETVWMSVYCVDASLHRPAGLSSVANIELLDASGVVVKQERIHLSSGFGKGQLFISPDIKSGYYTLRAYTNWMKNFESEYVYHQELSILNPSSSLTKDSLLVTKEKKISLKFFPEGGNLINGLDNNLAVQILNENNTNSNLEITCVVFDDQDNEITKFSTSRLGYSTFNLTPEKGRSYTARLMSDSLILSFELPKAKNTGLNIQVVRTHLEDFKVTLNRSSDFLNSIYVVVHTRGIIRLVKLVNLNEVDHILIPEAGLDAGISHITIMDDSFKAIAERLIFKYPELRNNIDLTYEDKYTTRQKVKLTLVPKGLKEFERVSNFSLSVFQTNKFKSHNIVSSLLLTSDIKGSISKPWIYFDQNNTARESQIDLIMLTHGWRRFDWKDVMKGKNINIRYPAEINSPIISGRLKKNLQGVTPNSLLVNIPGSESFANSINVDDDGSFSFEVPVRITGSQVLFQTMDDVPLEDDQIEISSSFNLDLKQSNDYKNYFSSLHKSFFENLNLNIQLSQIYRDFNKINGVTLSNNDIKPRFYGEPSHVYRLDDYVRFETINDLFIEYVRSASIRKRRGKTQFYVINKDSGEKIKPAFVLLDDVPVQDNEFMINYDPLKLERIEIVDNAYFLSNKSVPSILNFITYNGDFGGESLQNNVVSRAYKGIQAPREFYSPNYGVDGEKMERIPDYRNTLYWNPSVSINKEGKAILEFYTGDQTGSYQIEINGITSDGRTIHANESFEVKNDF